MKWIAYSLAVSLFASGSLVASSVVRTEPAPQESPPAQTETEDEDFIPTEKVPADSAISFPVDI
jgi:hypothetical protein